MDDFTVPLMRVLWKGPRREDLRSLMLSWIETNSQLVAITRLFWSNEDIDTELVKSLFAKGIEDSNRELLSSLLGIAASNYSGDGKRMLDWLFIPAVQELTHLKEPGWIHGFWYRKKSENILSDLDDDGQAAVLNSMLELQRIDYHAEEILISLAKNNPERVVDFFGQRLQHKSDLDSDDDYDAIPFALHELKNILAGVPKTVVEEARSWYSKGDYLFRFRGGRLLSIIFPQFGEEIEAELLELVRTNDKQNINFVLDVLSNYHGQPFLHNLCREIIIRISPDDELLTKVSIILQSTGVVSGEFGFAEAYERKIKEIEGWLQDDNKAVLIFANEYINSLSKQAISERQRAEEDIVLRKHTFGVREKKAEE
jgi:hypothetical protein